MTQLPLNPGRALNPSRPVNLSRRRFVVGLGATGASLSLGLSLPFGGPFAHAATAALCCFADVALRFKTPTLWFALARRLACSWTTCTTFKERK